MRNLFFSKIDKLFALSIFILCLLVFSGSFTLFLEGGARSQGYQNFVENTSFTKYIMYIHTPILIVFLLYLVFVKRKTSFPHSAFTGIGISIGIFVVFATFVQFFLGREISNNMLIILISVFFGIISLYLISSLVNVNYLILTLNSTYLYCFVFSYFLIVFFPSYGVSINETSSWQGMFNHKNNLGLFCSSYVIFSILSKKINPFVTYINLILAMVLVIGSDSYTNVFLFVVMLPFVFFNSKTRAFLYNFKGFIISVVFLFSISVVYVSISGVELVFLNKDSTFSSRNLIWQYSLVNYLNYPYLGQGINSTALHVANNSSIVLDETGQLVTNAHNGFIALLVDYGIFGFIFIFYLFYQSYRNIKSFAHDYAYALYCLYVSLVIVNTFEDKLIGFNVFLFLLIFVLKIFEINCLNKIK